MPIECNTIDRFGYRPAIDRWEVAINRSKNQKPPLGREKIAALS